MKKMGLSVLALSSRFDGPAVGRELLEAHYLSVLALSSRFDGHATHAARKACIPIFQYSLCRVVLMVCAMCRRKKRMRALSVLALSSRFDGHCRP